MSFELPQDRTIEQANHHSELTPNRTRKPYIKPLLQTVVIDSKNEVLGTSCFTSTQTSQQPGSGCKQVPIPACHN